MAKIYIFFLLFLVSCVTNRPPIWIKNFGRETSSKDILDGIGFANFNKKNKNSLLRARELAYNYAIKNLSLKLKTYIKGAVEYNLQDKIMYTDKKYKQQTTEQIDYLVNILFDVVLGRKYFEEYIDYKNSLYWVYVWTPKNELDKIVLEELKKQEAENISILKYSISQLNKIEEYIEKGNLTTTFKLLNTILLRLKEIKGITVIDNFDNISLKAEVENKFNKIISSIFIKPLTPTIFEIFDKKNLDLELKLKMYIKYNGENIAVVNFPLVSRFVKGSGEIDKVKFTDNNGEVVFRVYEIKEKENVIEVCPDLESLEISNEIKNFFNLKISYYVLVKSFKETSKFYISIKKTNDFFNIEFFKNEFLGLLSKNGFNMIEEYNLADYIIFLDLNLEHLTDKFFPNKENIYSYSGSIWVRIIKRIDNSIVLSKTFEGVKGFGKTKKEAELTLLRKLAEISSTFILDSLK